MKVSNKNRATAYLWLFRAGFDEKAVDVDGKSLPESLAEVLESAERDGRHAALRSSGEHQIHEDEPTGRYQKFDLEKLLARGAR